jgi:hypothetical protein
MKLIGERISINETKEKITIVILPHQSAWTNAAIGMWLAMWYVIGGTVVWSLFQLKLTQQEKIILFVFLIFWLYYATKITYTFLWILRGKEWMKLDDNRLTIKRSIGTLGKAHEYFYENIQHLSAHVPEKGSFQTVWESSPWVNGGDRIHFEHFHKPVRFGRKLDEKETRQLFAFLDKQIKERIKRK